MLRNKLVRFLESLLDSLNDSKKPTRQLLEEALLANSRHLSEISRLSDETLSLKNRIRTIEAEKEIAIASLNATVELERGRVRRLEETNLFLVEKLDRLTLEPSEYNEIQIPSKGLAQIESELKLCDKYTANAIAEYLEVDWYELVKNIAKTVNSANAAEVIAYRDGALSRNEATIKVLRKIGSASMDFKDRIRGEVR